MNRLLKSREQIMEWTELTTEEKDLLKVSTQKH